MMQRKIEEQNNHEATAGAFSRKLFTDAFPSQHWVVSKSWSRRQE